MNVLIVNGFNKTEKELKKFEEFVCLIKNIFKGIMKKTGIDHIEYFIRDNNDLDDFLFEQNSKQKKNSEKYFDKLDFVFIDGTENYLPWKQEGTNFKILLKMCKITGKSIFCCGVGMQNIIFFLATNYYTDVNVINPKEEIKTIEEIKLIPTDFLNNLKKNDFFLDYVTGDLYEFRTSNSLWIPCLNIGLHHQKLAEKYRNRGQYITGGKSYRPKTVLKEEIWISSNKEIKCNLQKQHLSHWLLKDLPLEFKVEISSNWIPHNICVNNIDLQYNILSTSEKGATIIEHENSIGCFFHITTKYKETVKILENFIHRKFSSFNVL